MENQYTKLRAIDVTKHIEKKSNLSYLSWAWACDTLLQHDPMATWEYREPQLFGQTMMVYCAVTAFGKTMTAQLPVMDHKNKAIANPDAFEVNKAMQRCLAKAIALHGIGLYIYAGEDLPEAPPAPAPALSESVIADHVAAIDGASSLPELKKVYVEAVKYAKFFKSQQTEDMFTAAKEERKAVLMPLGEQA
jgi:hypothetical protein